MFKKQMLMPLLCVIIKGIVLSGLTRRGAVITGTEASEDFFTMYTRVR